MGEEYKRKTLVLGSVSCYGPVILFDDIEGVFKWTGEGTGAETVEKSSTVAWNGSASLHVKCESVSPAEDEYAQASRLFYELPGRRYSFELMWMAADLTLSKYVSFLVNIQDSVGVYNIGFRYVRATEKWQYKIATANWVDVTGGSQSVAASAWHRLSFEFDSASGYFIKMVSDALEVDLSSVSAVKNAVPAAVYMSLVVMLENAGAAAAEAWFDDALIIQI